MRGSDSSSWWPAPAAPSGTPGEQALARRQAQTNTITGLQLRCVVCPLPLLQADALLADVAGQRTLLDQAGKAQQLLAQVRMKAVTKPA